MGFGEAINAGFTNYANFTGRAPRSAYWYWTLFVVLGSVLASIVDSTAGSDAGLLNLVFSLGTLLPSIAVGARRLHDIDRSGWWQLISVIPVVGWIILLVWFCTPGTPGPNRFG
ncbi:MAG: DUF805 domain-containing protein [Acetobacteraceae bacterium]